MLCDLNFNRIQICLTFALEEKINKWEFIYSVVVKHVQTSAIRNYICFRLKAHHEFFSFMEGLRHLFNVVDAEKAEVFGSCSGHDHSFHRSRSEPAPEQSTWGSQAFIRGAKV